MKNIILKSRNSFSQKLSLNYLFLTLLFLLFSCSHETQINEPGNAIDNAKNNAKVTTSEKIGQAIDLVTDCFTRNSASLSSFVIEGQSMTFDSDKKNWEFESSIQVKFNGQNTFYRKDVWGQDTIENYERYNSTESDENKKWSIWTVSDGTTTKNDASKSEIYSLYSLISELKDSVKNATADPNTNLYTVTDNNNRSIIFGFDGNYLTYLEVPGYIESSKYVLAFTKYNSNITINVPN